MSSVVAYNAQGQQVKNYATLYNNINNNNMRNMNYKKTKVTSNMPTGISSSEPQTYPASEKVFNYKPQPLLHKQLEERYTQIHSEPKPSSYEAYAGNTQSTYAKFN